MQFISLKAVISLVVILLLFHPSVFWLC